MCICSSLCAFPRRRSATNSGSRNKQLKDAIRWNRNSQVDNSPDQAKLQLSHGLRWHGASDL
jgi:hypothetical protein